MMTGTEHNRPDGSECPYLAMAFCNKCGWHDPLLDSGPGARAIAAERQRQVGEEGWTPGHDARHAPAALAIAGACYALPADLRGMTRRLGARPGEHSRPMPQYWPWEPSYWKPSPDNRILELVKAGALIAAEIDRLSAAAEVQ